MTPASRTKSRRKAEQEESRTRILDFTYKKASTKCDKKKHCRNEFTDTVILYLTIENDITK
jgi:hypothetical protein